MKKYIYAYLAHHITTTPQQNACSTLCTVHWGAVILAFFTFRGITTLRVQGFGNWQKKFFLAKTVKCVYWYGFKVEFQEPRFTDLYHFSACFIYWILNTHIKFEVSKSKTVVTREWSKQGSKYICLQSLESKLYLTKIFLKNSLWRHLPSTMF